MGEVNEVHAGTRENLDEIAIEVFLYIIRRPKQVPQSFVHLL